MPTIRHIVFDSHREKEVDKILSGLGAVVDDSPFGETRFKPPYYIETEIRDKVSGQPEYVAYTAPPGRKVVIMINSWNKLNWDLGGFKDAIDHAARKINLAGIHYEIVKVRYV